MRFKQFAFGLGIGICAATFGAALAFFQAHQLTSAAVLTLTFGVCGLATLAMRPRPQKQDHYTYIAPSASEQYDEPTRIQRVAQLPRKDDDTEWIDY